MFCTTSSIVNRGNVLAWSLCHVSWVYADSQFLGCFYNDHAVHPVCWLFLLLDHAIILHPLEFFLDTIMECYWHLSRSMYHGWTLGSSLILYSPGRQHNPLNESAYSSVISTPTEQSLSISPSLWHASTPRIALLSISVTKNWTLCSTLLQTHVKFVVPSVLMWCPEYGVGLALEFVIFLSLTRLSVLNTLCEMILHLAPVSSWKFTLIPSTSMVLCVFTVLMSFWYIVPTKYCVPELSESSTVFTLCLCERWSFSSLTYTSSRSDSLRCTSGRLCPLLDREHRHVACHIYHMYV